MREVCRDVQTEPTHLPINEHDYERDNTNWRAVFPIRKCELSAGWGAAAHKTKGRALFCSLPGRFFVQPSSMPFSAAHLPILWCSLLARPSVQLASLRKIHVFHVAT